MPSQVMSALLRSARSYAGQLTSLVKSFAPNHLQAGIKTTVTTPQEGKIVIYVSAKGADAHAQEYGSGLHTDGRKGAKAKYPIRPKPGNKYLAFQWDVAEAHPEVAKFLPDGRFYIPSVMHPGIKKYKGRGYINPAIRELRKRIRQKGSSLKMEVKRAIFGEINKSFTGAKKNG